MSTSSAPRLVICGAPGSDKATQCQNLVDEYGVIHLSSGNMIRAAISDATKIGKQARVYANRGEPIPDSLIIDLVLDRILEDDCVLTALASSCRSGAWAGELSWNS